MTTYFANYPTYPSYPGYITFGDTSNSTSSTTNIYNWPGHIGSPTYKIVSNDYYSQYQSEKNKNKELETKNSKLEKEIVLLRKMLAGQIK